MLEYRNMTEEENKKNVSEKMTMKEIKKEHLRDSKSIIIMMERTMCFGFCPAYKLTIYGDGRVVYNGKDYVKIVGTRIAKISQKKVKELINKFYKIDFFSLKEKYEALVTDNPSTITSIKINNKIKTVVNETEIGRREPILKGLDNLNDKIDEITNSARWTTKSPEEIKKEKERIRKNKERAEKKRKIRQVQQFKELRRYLKEIRETPALTQRRENSLWEKIAEEEKEPEEKIFKTKLPLVVSVAKKYYRKQSFFTTLELIKEGCEGLREGIESCKKSNKKIKELREKYRDYKKFLRRFVGRIERDKDSTWMDFWIKPKIKEKIDYKNEMRDELAKKRKELEMGKRKWYYLDSYFY